MIPLSPPLSSRYRTKEPANQSTTTASTAHGVHYLPKAVTSQTSKALFSHLSSLAGSLRGQAIIFTFLQKTDWRAPTACFTKITSTQKTRSHGETRVEKFWLLIANSAWSFLPSLQDLPHHHRSAQSLGSKVCLISSSQRLMP